MRNLFLMLTIGLAFLAQTKLQAFSADRLPIIKIDAIENERMVQLHFANLLQEVTYIEIIDKNGRVLYDETIRAKKAYAKKVKLDNLPDGKYSVHIEHERIDVVQPILLDAVSAKVLTNKRIEKLAPTIEFENLAVSFQLASGVKAKKVSIAFLKGEEIIYETTETLNDFDQKRYKLDNFSPGSYTFRAIVANKTYYKRLKIK